MKKTLRITAIILALLMVTLVFASCGKTLEGTYSTIVIDMVYELTFDGENVTIAVKNMGLFVANATGTYEIKDDRITLNFDSDYADIKAYNGTFDFEEGDDYIQIGSFGKFTKKKN